MPRSEVGHALRVLGFETRNDLRAALEQQLHAEVALPLVEKKQWKILCPVAVDRDPRGI